MLSNTYLRKLITKYCYKYNVVTVRLNSDINLKKLEQEDVDLQELDEEKVQKEQEIELKRNKSRLKEHHRNILMKKNPYPEETYWYQNTLKYKRRLYGRYGAESGVNPSICWPTKEEFEDKLEYEKVAYPFTIPEMIETSHKQRQEKEEAEKLRQQEMVKKMDKLEDWIKDLHNRIAKKEAEANAAKERRERLIEEVRRHFGFTVDPRDDRFKQMLEKKEKEQKKAMKEARRKAREEQMLSKLLVKEKKDETPAEKQKGEGAVEK